MLLYSVKETFVGVENVLELNFYENYVVNN